MKMLLRNWKFSSGNELKKMFENYFVTSTPEITSRSNQNLIKIMTYEKCSSSLSIIAFTQLLYAFIIIYAVIYQILTLGIIITWMFCIFKKYYMAVYLRKLKIYNCIFFWVTLCNVTRKEEWSIFNKININIFVFIIITLKGKVVRLKFPKMWLLSFFNLY